MITKKMLLLPLAVAFFAPAALQALKYPKRITVIPRRFEVTNKSANDTIHVRLHFVTGGEDTMIVKPGKSETFKWHRGRVYNITRVSFTNDPGSRWGSEKWRILDIPKDRQGRLLPYSLVYHSLDDYQYKDTLI